MKRAILLISAVLLSVVAGIQTALAQKVTLYMADNQTYECDVSRLDSIVFSDAPATVEPEEIVVTVDANGNADGGHRFEKINDSNYYIDDIKYTAQSGSLVVTGYNKAFFNGAAKIISVLKYNGRTMNVVSIGSSAFSGCRSLTSVTIPNSVTSIGVGAFDSCSGLTSVTIGNGVTSIGVNAFTECCSLTSITIGNSLTSIGGSAFSGCSSLTSVTIPESVTSIGNYAFDSCTNLTSVIIGSGVTNIGEWAFCDCSSLTDVYCFAENVPGTNGNVFYNSPISSATLHVPAGSVDAYKAQAPWKYFESIVAIE